MVETFWHYIALGSALNCIVTNLVCRNKRLFQRLLQQGHNLWPGTHQVDRWNAAPVVLAGGAAKVPAGIGISSVNLALAVKSAASSTRSIGWPT